MERALEVRTGESVAASLAGKDVLPEAKEWAHNIMWLADRHSRNNQLTANEINTFVPLG